MKRPCGSFPYGLPCGRWDVDTSTFRYLDPPLCPLARPRSQQTLRARALRAVALGGS